MGLLFQAFVKTFYARETGYKVSAPKIDWFGAENSEADLRHLPGMQTDIALRSCERTIILGTKFYKNPLNTRFGGQRVHSGNLYQIFAYVMNWAAEASAGDPQPEGWLLYAAVDRRFDYRFELMGRSIRVCSIDLAQDWRAIESDLKELLVFRTHPAPGQMVGRVSDPPALARRSSRWCTIHSSDTSTTPLPTSGS